MQNSFPCSLCMGIFAFLYDETTCWASGSGKLKRREGWKNSVCFRKKAPGFARGLWHGAPEKISTDQSLCSARQECSVNALNAAMRSLTML